MAEGFCGQSCETCDSREAYSCAGCGEAACALLPAHGGREGRAHFRKNRLAALGGPENAASAAKGLRLLFWLALASWLVELVTALLNSLLWRLLDHGNGAGMVSNGISLTWNIIVVLLMLRGLTLLCPAEPRFRTTRRWWAAASASLLLTSLLTLLAWRGSFSRLAVDLIGRGNGVGYLLQAAYFFCFCGAMEVLLKKAGSPRAGTWRRLRPLAVCVAAVKGVFLLADLSWRRPQGKWGLEADTPLRTALLCAAVLAAAGVSLLALAVNVLWAVQLHRSARDLRELGQPCQPE